MTILIFNFQGVWALIEGYPSLILGPYYRAGFAGKGDQRDADTNPAIAYDETTKRFLAVWMTAVNADSSTDGFDVYGIFLNQGGSPLGSAFRISDSNTVARNGSASVVAGNGEFLVTWTKRGGNCQIYTQRITNSSSQADVLLISGSGHHHSSDIVYNPIRARYAIAYVAGDDYLPPKFFNSDTDDCGNNASSASQIKLTEFHFSNGVLISDATVNISGTGGAFRPRLAFSDQMMTYFVVWEDRQNVSVDFSFDVYGQRLNNNLAPIGNNIILDSDKNYVNVDDSATWTPRPVVTGGESEFFVTWFSHQSLGSTEDWSVLGSLVPATGSPGAAFSIAHMTYAVSHVGQAPTGFLDVAYAVSVQEYLVGLSSHLESLWGYLSFALVQRIDTNGQLLRQDGTLQNQSGVGTSIDFALDDQIGITMAVVPSQLEIANYAVLYSKHAVNQHSQDFDIWSAIFRVASPDIKTLYLPISFK
jgi:hypothetical protein